MLHYQILVYRSQITSEKNLPIMSGTSKVRVRPLQCRFTDSYLLLLSLQVLFGGMPKSPTILEELFGSSLWVLTETWQAPLKQPTLGFKCSYKHESLNKFLQNL
jgi:hypothetical protein